MSREDPQFKLRMTEDLKAKVEEAAKANNRSMNAELLARLEASFASVDGDNVTMTRAQLNELVSSIASQVAEQMSGTPEALGRKPKPHDPAEGGNGKPTHVDPKEGGNGKPKAKKPKTSKP